MLITALLLGFVGSLHCLGMCSPLVVAVTQWKTTYFRNRVVYNSTRIICYAVQGAIMGSVGSLFNFPKFQTIFSLIFGAILIVLAIGGVTNFKLPWITYFMQSFTRSIKSLFAQFLNQRSVFSLSILGFLNGLLPCGLTYLALSYCIILPHFTDGFFFMLLFGVGTLPVMLGFTSVAQLLIKKLSLNFQKFTIGALLISGTLLLVRGMHEYESKPATLSTSIIVCQPK